MNFFLNEKVINSAWITMTFVILCLVLLLVNHTRSHHNIAKYRFYYEKVCFIDFLSRWSDAVLTNVKIESTSHPPAATLCTQTQTSRLTWGMDIAQSLWFAPTHHARSDWKWRILKFSVMCFALHKWLLIWILLNNFLSVGARWPDATRAFSFDNRRVAQKKGRIIADVILSGW